ncbi:DUF1491 family protein [Roseobacter sinensis]|uniref:DUF1491 family protein n=1 Tax=Roseobacter sinensis TaxID=2931391 RepID=A0ABT3BDD5_9RHOB|nr:DUF1491 family protein [Roseobacter sp. WL0113]MCV3271572.1 DUF1491 family protein [Roseobacter sp. WL0113]
MTRLTARFWIDAYLTRLRGLDIPAFIVARGDDDAGSVLVKLNRLDGQATIYHRSYNLMEDTRSWSILEQGSEAEVDACIHRQRKNDPDVWVIEVEDRQGRHMLDQPGFA